ncbi:MAG: ROK family transcriptional regulator [Actinomycetaceae bacterium]|nr:ROK family transcriptional regulator [Actinomycetaceae bacterium]
MLGLYDDSAMATAAHILTNGPISRAEIARALQLSPGTLTRLVKPLLEAELVIDEGVGVPKSGMGRPTQLLDIPACQHRFIGINISVGAVHAVTVDARARVQSSKRISVTNASPSEIGEVINALMATMLPNVSGSLRGIGLSLGGAIREGRVKENRFFGWRDVDIRTYIDLPEAVPFSVVNDLEALTVFEQWFMLGRKVPSFALVTVGAGVGHGLVHLRRRLRAPSSGYGMTGHFPLAGAHGICQYGHISCANGALTTSALLGRARSGRGILNQDRRPADQNDLIVLADEGDVTARTVIDEYVRNLATYIQAVACASMVTDVVIDGEGVHLLDTPWSSSFDELLQSYRSPNIPVLTAHRRSGSFERWAQGAATHAIISWLEDRVLSAHSR